MSFHYGSNPPAKFLKQVIVECVWKALTDNVIKINDELTRKYPPFQEGDIYRISSAEFGIKVTTSTQGTRYFHIKVTESL